MLSYGKYDHGSGLEDDPMVFTGGSDVSCSHVRIVQGVPENYNKSVLWDTL